MDSIVAICDFGCDKSVDGCCVAGTVLLPATHFGG